ncbi:Asp23/Gls24 family envelope stress response protein [Selenomonas sp. ND2010]|uniref:Asp23/Gls24 family envelope stress response protein n=1 Tax=Selenomonas sp. ND2010 TaxID=1410618 RepID=UPI00051B9408|nr:Asp23/Gls24 family envelope stress response protein [Selenomonas sp. ND2010]
MDVIALVGPSGTGKSHRALVVAHDNHADAIIDDGILIKDGKILAGHSAKKEQSKIMAVRRAIFVLPGHAEEVRAAIDEAKPHRILILGTSENMVHKIAKALRLPSIAKIINIADVASKQEMEKAQYYRLKQGKHIIPVPTIELKPHFSGYLVDPLQTFFKRSSTKRRRLGEKSIVRPVFSYYGKLSIDDSAIKAIIRHVVMKQAAFTKIGGLQVEHLMQNGEDMGLRISCDVVLTYGNHIPTLIRQVQKEIRDAVEFMTGMVVHEVNIRVKALYVPS